MGEKNSEAVARKLLIYSQALPKGLVGSGSAKGTAASESAVLHYLSTCDPEEGVIPSEIAAQMGYSRARVTRILDALEARDEIVRVHDSEDRRRVLVYITEHGRRTISEYNAKSTKALSHFLEGLGEEDSQELLRILRKGYKITYGSHSPDDLDV